MIPSYFIKLPEIPLTINGKLNRKALPEPDKNNEDLFIDDRTIVPLTKTEILLADIWESVLGITVRDRNDNFFELGGNSLSIITVSSQVRTHFGFEIPLNEVYADPTLKAYAALIDKRTIGEDYETIGKAIEQADYPASAAQRRIFMLKGIDDESIVYNMPGAIRITGEFSIKRLKEAFRQLVARHDQLRTAVYIKKDSLRQKVYKNVKIEIVSHSCEVKGLGAMLKSFIKPFNIASPPLIRIEHIELSKDDNVVFIDMHHIISDGISYEILVRQLADIYENRRIPEERYRYSD
jgi:bacitracin synthase 3